MYQDTDIILALIKPSDWLSPHVNLKKLKNPKTSTLTLVEAQIVLNREYSRKTALDAFDKIKSTGIEIEPLNLDVVEKSAHLLKKYDKLTIFDSVHAAFVILNKDVVLSTDSIFDSIEGVIRIDPRKLEK